jgi:hypothetical protein
MLMIAKGDVLEMEIEMTKGQNNRLAWPKEVAAVSSVS